MFLRSTERFKDGKTHKYWSIVENRRVRGKKVVQQTVLYLGEISDAQKEEWVKAIEVFDEDCGKSKQVELFPEKQSVPEVFPNGVQVKLKDFEMHRPRQWGACWLFMELWKELGLEEFWETRLRGSRKGTKWEHVLATLCCYRLLDPGSEWRLHRYWYEHSAMADLLEEDFSIANKDTLYRCLDLLVEHKEALFKHLTERWKDLFGAKYEVLLYDLTSTYFESDVPENPKDMRRFGYSRDKCSDCVQVVIALIVTPDGLPLAYEVLPGNTSDKTTLKSFLEKIEHQYGKADRIWVMDRGIPTEEVLAQMRNSNPPVQYLVGTPRNHLNKMESDLLKLDWKEVRQGVNVKLLSKEGEVYLLARSKDRISKERAMRQRRLRKYLKALASLKRRSPMKRDQLHQALGAAKKEAGKDARHITLNIQLHSGEKKDREERASLSYEFNRVTLKEARRREGSYFLRSNLPPDHPEKLWNCYIQLTQVEEAFKNLKGDLSIRPIFHQLEHRIEAHIFVAFLAFCVHTTLRQYLRLKAPGLTPRSVLEQLKTIQMLDVHFPTTDGRTLIFSRYTMPNKTQKLLLSQLGRQLPPQSPPRITSNHSLEPLKNNSKF